MKMIKIISKVFIIRYVIFIVYDSNWIFYVFSIQNFYEYIKKDWYFQEN